jgi:anti-anti-sigma regulatory factor
MSSQFTDTDLPDEILKLQPRGHFNIDLATELREQVRLADTGIELDLSSVDSIDLPALQFILVLIADKRRRQLPVVINDSEAGVLRSLVDYVGLQPEVAGLSARLVL